MNEKETPQVLITLTSDLYYTADFLRELANAIEDEGTDLEHYETANGDAVINWPEEAYDEEETVEEAETPVEKNEVPIEQRIEDVLMIVGTIDKAETALSLFGEPRFVDEKIDDGLDENEDGDTYLMMRSYDVGIHYVRIFYGDNSGKIGCVDVE